MKKKKDKKVLRKEPGPMMGVCAGLAKHYDFDPLPLRLMFLMSFMALKLPVFFLYLIIGWMLMEPIEDEDNA